MDITNATGEDVSYRIEETERAAEREFCAAEARPECPKCRGYGYHFDPETDERRTCLHCNGTGADLHATATPALDPCTSRQEAAYDAQVEAIVRRFLIPACQYQPAEGEPYDPHAPWKLVAFAGGVIAGWVSSFDPELVDRTHLAQRMTDDCGGRLLDLLAPTDTPDDGFAFARKVAGPNGLVKRTAEALLRLGVER